jgi:hypothetical protein
VPGVTVVAQVTGASAGMDSAVGAGAEEIPLHLFHPVIVILLVTRLVTVIVRRLGQTDASGEILAGLLLGPSLLGALFPPDYGQSKQQRRRAGRGLGQQPSQQRERWEKTQNEPIPRRFHRRYRLHASSEPGRPMTMSSPLPEQPPSPVRIIRCSPSQERGRISRQIGVRSVRIEGMEGAT